LSLIDASVSALRLRNLARDERGLAAVEFALVAPVLILLLAGVVDGTRLISQTMQVKAAAQAGVDVARSKGWDAAKIGETVNAAVTPSITASPAPALTLACVSDGNIVPSLAASCGQGLGAPGRFVTVSAHQDFKPLMPWPGVTPLVNVDSKATVRIQ
jgi:Flp pilus assembly protein TadG